MLVRPQSAVGWDLRTYMALGRTVRLVLSERCDGILPRLDGERVLEGKVTSVSPTDGFVIVCGRHVPMTEILAIHRPHFAQDSPSDPTDPLEREAEDLRERLR